eukprot:767481-Hanusia_phi.AAC.1
MTRSQVGLDVFQGEPSEAEVRTEHANFTNKLASHPNVVCTHHIGAATTQAQVCNVGRDEKRGNVIISEGRVKGYKYEWKKPGKDMKSHHHR